MTEQDDTERISVRNFNWSNSNQQTQPQPIMVFPSSSLKHHSHSISLRFHFIDIQWCIWLGKSSLPMGLNAHCGHMGSKEHSLFMTTAHAANQSKALWQHQTLYVSLCKKRWLFLMSVLWRGLCLCTRHHSRVFWVDARTLLSSF